jgi:hypothetical protein
VPELLEPLRCALTRAVGAARSLEVEKINDQAGRVEPLLRRLRRLRALTGTAVCCGCIGAIRAGKPASDERLAGVGNFPSFEWPLLGSLGGARAGPATAGCKKAPGTEDERIEHR